MTNSRKSTDQYTSWYMLRFRVRESICLNIFLFLTFENLRSSSMYKENENVFHLQKYWTRLPFTKKLRLSSICKKRNCLLLTNIITLTSIYKAIDAVFHFHKKNRSSARVLRFCMGPKVTKELGFQLSFKLQRIRVGLQIG